MTVPTAVLRNHLDGRDREAFDRLVEKAVERMDAEAQRASDDRQGWHAYKQRRADRRGVAVGEAANAALSRSRARHEGERLQVATEAKRKAFEAFERAEPELGDAEWKDAGRPSGEEPAHWPKRRKGLLR